MTKRHLTLVKKVFAIIAILAIVFGGAGGAILSLLQ